MNVLVTGGNGFIGGYTCTELEHRGHRAAVLDRRTARGRETLLGDIRDATAVTEAVVRADGVIHLAGVLGTQETITNPRPAAETNILGALNVLEACAQHGVPLVNIGTGNWFEASTYPVTKHCAERLTAMYARYRDVACCTVRAYNAYGPGQCAPRPHGTSRVRKIIPSFACRALAGEPVEVYGDGSQVMDMIHAGDVAKVLVAALEYLAGGGKPGGVVEAGTGRATTVAGIAGLVRAEACRQGAADVPVRYLPMRPGETPGSTVLAGAGPVLGLDRARFVTLEAGLKDTVAWYKALLA